MRAATAAGAVGFVMLLLAGGLAATAPPAKPAPPDPAEIPAADRNRPNPLSRSEETLRGGRALWRAHCETCHGVSGRGDGPNARLHERRKGIAPRNLTDPEVQENLTDGEIFFRVTNGIVESGSIIMPAHADKIPAATERWQVVLFVRELGRQARK